MNVGMLWFDNDNKSDLPTKVDRAATYYRGKYGVQPNICFVHPSMAGNSNPDKSKKSSIKSGGIEVRLTKSVIPHHFWIGVHHQDSN
ncbi:MAG: hypothetical protein JSV69_13440 [Chloroflexota bacterium]|nr:MAG: hypothetical protein JSV69_13440 [Chloroflexota bacterium]